MHEKHTDQFPLPQAITMLKGMKKHEDKEHGKTLKHEVPRSINHKATQNKNNTGTTALEWPVAKAAVPDAIRPTVLKELGQVIAPAVTAIFRKSLDTCTVPPDWKNAQVCPLFKKGNKQDPANTNFFIVQDYGAHSCFYSCKAFRSE